MNYLFKKVDEFYNKKIDGRGLAVFRILYCLVLLAEVIQFFYFRHLVFDKIPFIEEGPIDPTIPILLWIACIIFLVFGCFTRLASIVNYLFSLIFIGTITSYEYHMFYVYMGLNCLFIFLPVSQCWSLDRLFKKLRYSGIHTQYDPPMTVPALAYTLPVFITVGYVYIDSVFFKITSYNWMSGLGMWVPSSLPMITHSNASFLLDNEFLIKFLGYLTLAFETVFVFLFWFRKFRVPLLIIGLGLHIGILVQFPIPWFALGYSAIYLLMVPVKVWKKLFTRTKASSPVLTFYYDLECPLCLRTKIVIEHLDVAGKIKFASVQSYASAEPALKDIPEETLLLDIHSVDKKGKVYKGVDSYIRAFRSIFYLKPLSWLLRIPGIYHLAGKVYRFTAENRTRHRCTEANCGFKPQILPGAENQVKIMENISLKDLKVAGILAGVLFLTLLQLNTTYNSAFIKNLRESSGFESTKPGRTIGKASTGLSIITRTLFGITTHAVFMDFHFNKYNHIIAITYKPQDGGAPVFLPIIDEKGMPGFYIYGPNWVKWTFRVNAPNVNTRELETGIRDFTAFWAHRNNVDLNNATFEILVKKVETPVIWRKHFLEEQIRHPWQSAGEITWENRQFKVVSLSPIESL
ncbi:DCC1-like thiol-disulfide oxidoreductase family protein [Chitinophaga sp. GCM10012297]|uniref:DUF393 domain-containing protein n=1 Tax=Chitinophaga chungangae TaxID=2821488 RepID=A0ABS3YEZ4_9BACT|nr:DCC1-like thiol-disulfide oxidoreductase family protein [Chitinophaga chungangae]MBO9153255.1 DUF393 domain-containing protein [Chitinophaga chungangae]